MSLWDELSLVLCGVALAYCGTRIRAEPADGPPERRIPPIVQLPPPPDPVYPPVHGRPSPSVHTGDGTKRKPTPKYRFIGTERVPYDHTPDDHDLDYFEHSKDECHD